MTVEIRTICNRDCPDSCSVVATVENGRIVKHKGDPNHGVTQGFLCFRGNRYLDRFYSKDRIIYPQRKTAKGWERVSWDDAFDLLVAKLTHYRERFGPLSVAYISYSGIKGLVTKAMARIFWDNFGGATVNRGGLSVEASTAAQKADFGAVGTHAPEDFANSKAFVLWGKNVAVTRVHCWPFIKQARKRGAEVVVIDPVRSKTASRADLHLQIRPGSDGLLAAGIARLMLDEGQIDRDFIENHSNGFSSYRELIYSIPIQDVLDGTGVTMEEIRNVARLYSEIKPLATLIGLGPSYWTQGGATVRLIDALAAISGNIGVPGGGANTDIEGGYGLDRSLFKVPSRHKHRSISLPRLGEEILATTDPPLKMGFVAGANPAATCPDTGLVRQGLDSLEFLVVVDQFMTATAEAADLFLPCATYLELDDLVTAYGHQWLGLDQIVVDPMGECKSDMAIFQALANRMGFGAKLDGEPSVWIDRFLEPLGKFGITREALKEKPMLNPMADPVPFTDKKFRTASGKFEFISEYTPQAPPSIHGKQLRLMATKTLKMVNAQINTEDLPAEPHIKARPETIAALNLKTGNRVVVESQVGSVTAILEEDPEVLPEVVLFNPAAWHGDLQGVNQLRESLVSDLGEAAAMHETFVTIRAAGD